MSKEILTVSAADYRSLYDVYESLKDENATLRERLAEKEAEIERMKGYIEKYGSHKGLTGNRYPDKCKIGEKNNFTCTCGYQDMLREVGIWPKEQP